jgi:hypothetical protein
MAVLSAGILGEWWVGAGTQIALITAVVQIGLIHWYLAFTQRRHRSTLALSLMMIDALERALPEGSDIFPSDQMAIKIATHRHRCQFGDPTKR